MVREVNRDVLIGFIEEAQSYLPSILEGIKAFNEDPARLDGLEEAHRYIHTIKGASSMIGLPGLSHIAHYVEETLEVIVAGTLDLTNESSDLLLQTVAQIGDYLDDLLDGRLKERPLVTDITRAFHRLRGLPVKEDAAILKQVLAEIDAAPNFGAEILPGETHDLETEAVSSELMEIFSMEADDHLRSISTLLAELEKTPGEVNLLQDIRRSVHTLKGAAGVVGFNSIAKLSHRMEDLLDLLYNGSLKIHPEILDLLFDTADALNDLMQGDYQGSDDQKELDRLYDRFSDWLMPDSILEQETTLNLDNQISVPDEKPIELSELPPFLEETAEERDIVKTGFSAGRRSSPLVRVPLDRLDELVNRVGEIVINRTTLEQEMGRLVQAVEELQSSAERLSRISTNLETQYEVSTFRSSAPRLKGAQPVTDGNAFLPDEDNGEQIDPLSYFDELEFDRYTEFHMLSRELSETTSDIKTIGSELSTSIGDFGSMLNRQGTISSELQEKLMRTRMVPLATLSTRFHRMVRTIARDQGKLVDLVIEGQDIELDKTVLEEMSDSLLHLLRNA
ncbi:MAG: Hpt domain-containing protein, partial [Chloroflexota bacterium]